MDCKRHEKWLTDAALGALSPARKRKLDAHLAECASCQAQLERERRLLASIDSTLAQNLDVQLPAGFAARVRVRLAEEAATPRPWPARWIPLLTGALAVAVLAIVGLVSWQTALLRRQKVESRSQESGVRSRKTAESRSQESGARSQKRASLRSRLRHAHGGRRGDAEPQVLVDKNQWAAIIQLYNDAQSGRVDGLPPAAKQDEDADIPPKPIEIKPLEVPPKLDAELKPLNPRDGGETR